MKHKLSGTHLMAGAIVLLAVIICASAAVHHFSSGAGAGEADGSLTVMNNGEQVKVFTYDEITSMEYIDADKEILSSDKKSEKGTYRGVPLREIIGAADSSLLAGGSVTAEAADGFMAAFSMQEILEGDSIIVAYEKDGEPLPSQKEGGSGPLRIVALDDMYGTRSTMYLSAINVE